VFVKFSPRRLTCPRKSFWGKTEFDRHGRFLMTTSWSRSRPSWFERLLRSLKLASDRSRNYCYPRPLPAAWEVFNSFQKLLCLRIRFVIVSRLNVSFSYSLLHASVLTLVINFSQFSKLSSFPLQFLLHSLYIFIATQLLKLQKALQK